MNGAPLVAQRLKRLPIMRETWVRSLGREDPLKKEMATHSSILAWKIPWTEEPGRLQTMGYKYRCLAVAMDACLLQCRKVKSESEVAQSYLTL